MDETVLDFLSVFMFYKFMSATKGMQRRGCRGQMVFWTMEWNGSQTSFFYCNCIKHQLQGLATFTGYAGNAALGMPLTEFMPVQPVDNPIYFSSDNGFPSADIYCCLLGILVK